MTLEPIVLLKLTEGYIGVGYFEVALRYAEEAKSKNESLGDRAGVYYSLHHMGVCQVELNHFDEALKTFERALKADSTLSFRMKTFVDLFNVGR